MNKIQILRITNNIILALSIIGYFILWKDTTNANKTIDLLGLTDVATYVNAYLIESVIISILIWLFISTFCENAEDTKEVLALLKGKNIQKQDKQKQDKQKLTNTLTGQLKGLIKNKKSVDKEEIIEVEGMKHTVNANELIVKVKGSGKIEKIKKEDWEEIISLGNEDKFEIKYKK